MTPEQSFWELIVAVLEALKSDGQLEEYYAGRAASQPTTGARHRRVVLLFPEVVVESDAGTRGARADLGTISWGMQYRLEVQVNDPGGDPDQDLVAGTVSRPGIFTVAGAVRDAIDVNLAAAKSCTAWEWPRVRYLVGEGGTYPRHKCQMGLVISNVVMGGHNRSASQFPPAILPPLPPGISYGTGIAPLRLPAYAVGEGPLDADLAEKDFLLVEDAGGVLLRYKRPSDGQVVEVLLA